MATERVIHNSKLETLFSDFDAGNVIKKGNTSVIMEHYRYDTMVIVYTTDKAKLNWFERLGRRVSFKLLDTKNEESAYDEIPQKIYKFQIKRMEELDEKRQDYVKEHILDKYNSIVGFLPNMKFLKIAKEAKDKRVKYMMFLLKSFIEHNRVETELKLNSFMKLPNGDIICTDPIYSTKER